MFIIDDIDALKQRISSLEEYCLNVDHHHLPVPAALSYLFEKTHGTYKYEDGTVYEGELVRGVPSGYGRHSVSNFIYEGQYVNGKKHGHVECHSYVFHSKCRYLHGTKDGLEVSVHNDGTVKALTFQKGVAQLVERIEHRDKSVEYLDIRDGVRNGLDVTFDSLKKLVYVFNFEDHEVVGRGKKYVYKSEV